MSDTIRIFTGPSMVAKALIARLNDINISPIERNESNSAAMSGFGGGIPQQTQLFIMEDEVEKAKPIVDAFLNEIE